MNFFTQNQDTPIFDMLNAFYFAIADLFEVEFSLGIMRNFFHELLKFLSNVK